MKILVSIFNLISPGLLFSPEDGKHTPSAPDASGTHLAGLVSSVKHTLSRKGGVGVGLPCLLQPRSHP